MQSNLPDDIEGYKQREGSPWQDYNMCNNCHDYLDDVSTYCRNCDDKYLDD